jgi:hypothetical protein
MMYFVTAGPAAGAAHVRMTVDPLTVACSDVGANGDGGGSGSGVGAGAGPPPPPPPPPPLEGGGGGRLTVHESNVTVRPDGVVIVQVAAVPGHAPPHPLNVEPLAAVAVKVTVVPVRKAKQFSPQLEVRGVTDERIVPPPSPSFVTITSRRRSSKTENVEGRNEVEP